MNEGQWLKDNLCTPSDDEKEMKAPDSDESISSASCGTICDEQDFDNWFLFSNTNSNSLISNLENETMYVPDDEANANSVINGLHWEFDGVINEEPSEKQPPKQTTIKSGCEHLFKTPINSTLAIFPLHFLGNYQSGS